MSSSNASPMLARARRVHAWCKAFGVDPVAASRAVRRFPGYVQEIRSFKSGVGTGQVVELLPQLLDRDREAGVATGHYFWQDLLVARRIFETSPKRHVDVGSRLDGFVAHLLTFRTVEVVDIRTVESPVYGLRFIQDDATTLGSLSSRSIPSLSSLHAIEHFGLGRYGDPIAPHGHVDGLLALQRVLAPKGKLWISFPIGRPRVQFNGQRIIHPGLAVETMAELQLERFVAIPPEGLARMDLSPQDLVDTDGWCGLYEFTRPPESRP